MQAPVRQVARARRWPDLQLSFGPHAAKSAALSDGRCSYAAILERQLLAAAWLQSVSMALPKTIVYVLKSEPDPARYYTGLTSNLADRLEAHNAGRCPHTASGKPWIIDVIVRFSDERRAVAFEHYLKSGSDNALAKRHLRREPSCSFV